MRNPGPTPAEQREHALTCTGMLLILGAFWGGFGYALLTGNLGLFALVAGGAAVLLGEYIRATRRVR